MRTQVRGPAQELLEELGMLQDVVEGERGTEGRPVSFYYERAGQLLPLGQILPRGAEFVFLQGEDSDGEWFGVLAHANSVHLTLRTPKPGEPDRQLAIGSGAGYVREPGSQIRDR